MVRAFAARAVSLTELDSLISSLSYPSLERRLSAMRQLELVEAEQTDGRRTWYRPSVWLRQAVGPLVVASRWEQRHLVGDAPPVTNRDVETAFLLILPLLHLPEPATGTCRLAVQIRGGAARRLVGATAELRAGRVVACRTSLKGIPDAWAHGPTEAWLSAVARGEARCLECGGNGAIYEGMIVAFHEVLRPASLPNQHARRNCTLH